MSNLEPPFTDEELAAEGYDKITKVEVLQLIMDAGLEAVAMCVPVLTVQGQDIYARSRRVGTLEHVKQHIECWKEYGTKTIGVYTVQRPDYDKLTWIRFAEKAGF